MVGSLFFKLKHIWGVDIFGGSTFFGGPTEYNILRYGVLKYDKGNLKQIVFKLLNTLLYTSVFSFPTSMGTGATI